MQGRLKRTDPPPVLRSSICPSLPPFAALCRLAPLTYSVHLASWLRALGPRAAISVKRTRIAVSAIDIHRIVDGRAIVKIARLHPSFADSVQLPTALLTGAAHRAIWGELTGKNWRRDEKKQQK